MERNLERLERKRRFLNDRLERQRQRINEQFDRKQAELSKRLNTKQEEIVATALELLDAEGLANLSLRKLASKLNMQAPGLYWHFKNKELLIDYMAEAMLQDEFKELQPCPHDEAWQEWLTNTLRRLRKAMLVRTDGARVVAGAHIYPAVTLGKLYEYSLQSLKEAGLTITVCRQVVLTATTYTFGFVIEEQSSPSEEQFAGSAEDLMRDFPVAAEAMHGAREHALDYNEDTDFNAGLQLIIGGIHTL